MQGFFFLSETAGVACIKIGDHQLWIVYWFSIYLIWFSIKFLLILFVFSISLIFCFISSATFSSFCFIISWEEQTVLASSHWLHGAVLVFITLFLSFCSGKHTLSAKRKRRQVQHLDPQISLQFSEDLVFTSAAFSVLRLCGNIPDPAFPTEQEKEAILFQDISLRTGGQLSEAQEGKGWENFSSEREPVPQAFPSLVCKTGDYCRKVQPSQLLEKPFKYSSLWLSLLQQLGLSLKFKLTFIPSLQFHFVPKAKFPA